MSRTAGLVLMLVFVASSSPLAKDEPTPRKKLALEEDRSVLEDVCEVPLRVRAFREALDLGPEGREHVLVELGPRMKKYILTDRDGHLIELFARNNLHMSDEDIAKLVKPRPEGGFQDYLSYAFKCSPLDALCNRIEKVFNERDRNRNGVLEPSER